jgi:hypothetical protein
MVALLRIAAPYVVIACLASIASWFITDNVWQTRWSEREAEYSRTESEAAKNAKTKQEELQKEVNDAATNLETAKRENKTALDAALADKRVISLRFTACQRAARVREAGSGSNADEPTTGEGLPGGVPDLGGATLDPSPMKVNAAECNDMREQVLGLQRVIRAMEK